MYTKSKSPEDCFEAYMVGLHYIELTEDIWHIRGMTELYGKRKETSARCFTGAKEKA